MNARNRNPRRKEDSDDHLHYGANNRPAGNRRPFYLGEREVMKKLTFEIRSPAHQQNAIHAVQQILPDPTKPIVVTIQERNRSIQQNARLHAMLSEISKKATYHGKARNIEFWKGLFVSGWQIATNQHPEIISGLEGELINIRESTATLSVKKISEIMDYIEAYCAMNSIHLSEWRNYD